jgi:protein SCO1/2
MSQPQKILTVILWIITVGVMLGVIAMRALPPGSGGGEAGAAQPIIATDGNGSAAATVLADPNAGAALKALYPAPHFTLTDQDGRHFSDQQLLGHPWVADFVFTTCSSLCPMMSAQMSALQAKLPKDVKLVSFSVDPAHDTPAVLKEYGTKLHAEAGRWTFLTGDEKTLERVVGAMKLHFAPAQGNTPLQHDEHFVLIDAAGNIHDFYDSFVPQDMDALVHDADSLSAQSSGAQSSGASPSAGSAQ